jgi:hypothetical protein
MQGQLIDLGREKCKMRKRKECSLEEIKRMIEAGKMNQYKV